MITYSELPGPESMATLASAVAAPVMIPADRLSNLLGAIYDTAQDTANWQICLRQLVFEFKANFASLIVRPGSTHDSGYIVSAANDFRTVPAYCDHIADSPLTGRTPEHVIVLDDILSRADWTATSYYRNYCKPNDVFHVMAADIRIPDFGVYGLRITRGFNSPPFSRDERLFCEQLIPHFKRALHLRAAVNQDEELSSLYRRAIDQMMIGTFLLDEAGYILERNAMADAIIQLEDGLTVSCNKLVANYSADNHALQRLIRKVLNHEHLGQPTIMEAVSVNRPSGRVAWGLVVQSITASEWTKGTRRPCAAVFLRGPEGKFEPPLHLTQQLFQLTAAETALAIQLSNGLSLDEASEALNIRRNTARAHLRSIFSKTGVRRQTELVRIFLNSVALLGNSPMKP